MQSLVMQSLIYAVPSFMDTSPPDLLPMSTGDLVAATGAAECPAGDRAAVHAGRRSDVR